MKRDRDEKEMKEKMISDELAQNVSKKSFSDEISLIFFRKFRNLPRAVEASTKLHRL